MNLISSITNQRLVCFMVYEKRLTAAVLLGFLSRLIQGHPKMIFLILDYLKIHRSRAVRTWSEVRWDRIKVFFTCRPIRSELNPDELLNSDLKGVLHAGLSAKNKAELKRKARSHLHRLLKRPEPIRRDFKHPKIANAAAVR